MDKGCFEIDSSEENALALLCRLDTARACPERDCTCQTQEVTRHKAGASKGICRETCGVLMYEMAVLDSGGCTLTSRRRVGG